MQETSELNGNVERLKKIFPQFESVTSNWLQNAMIHGHKQTPSEKKCLKEFANIMINLGVLDNG